MVAPRPAVSRLADTRLIVGETRAVTGAFFEIADTVVDEIGTGAFGAHGLVESFAYAAVIKATKDNTMRRWVVAAYGIFAVP
jgi:hypothetical protein